MPADQPTSGQGGGGEDSTHCWQAKTCLSVSKGPKATEDSAVIKTHADGGEYHIYLRVRWDTQKEYQCWVSFTYADGTVKVFAVPDRHSDRPVEFTLDVGRARVEDRQAVRLWREKKGDPHHTAESGTISLVWIKGCR